MADIWLRGSQLAHSFIPYSFWLSRIEDMKTVYLPNSETYVSVSESDVRGFVSLVDEHLAALFVHPSAQGQGYGKQLLVFAQSKRQVLSLCVYTQNRRAVGFYKKSGFRVLEERQEYHTGHPELLMEWSAADT
ncbi:GNAT family N-acetyltransferase [Halomonas sp. Bachu 37]|uniref:GNAT family N-acetyltransferase n=1 Tax=Halomonas kashgarensis TaxID=3084920 RepID=UPI00321688CF